MEERSESKKHKREGKPIPLNPMPRHQRRAIPALFFIMRSLTSHLPRQNGGGPLLSCFDPSTSVEVRLGSVEWREVKRYQLRGGVWSVGAGTGAAWAVVDEGSGHTQPGLVRAGAWEFVATSVTRFGQISGTLSVRAGASSRSCSRKAGRS